MDQELLPAAMRFSISLVTVLYVIEIYGWIRGTRLVNRKQKVLRTLSALFILSIFAMILVGDRIVRALHPLAGMAYWLLCFSLAVAVVLMALADVKQVALRFGEERKRNLDNLADGDR